MFAAPLYSRFGKKLPSEISCSKIYTMHGQNYNYDNELMIV